MSNSTPSRLGLKQGGTDADELFLKVWSGEVLTAFSERNKIGTRFYTRTIDSGKSASFPATWKATAAYHTPGTELVGQKIDHSERLINVDKLLVSDVFIALIDEAKNHYDVRSIYSNECGAALARQMDKTVAQVAVRAARVSATFTQGNAGGNYTDAAVGTNVDKLETGIKKAAQAFDEKDVDEAGRMVFLKPAQYYLLLDSNKLASRDYSGMPGVDYASGMVTRATGMEIVKSNNIPSTNISGSVNVEYDGDFTTTVAFVATPQAVGTVKLLDIQSEGEYQISKQGTLLVSKYAMGHGILRPECAFELKSS